jgi:RNA polymerase sigma-70 factor (ECF subfamily)
MGQEALPCKPLVMQSDPTREDQHWIEAIMSVTSASLLQRACDLEDHEAWCQLVELYTPLIRGWLGRYAQQSADADDLVQEVFQAISRKLPEFRHNRRTGAFRAWLRTIAVNALRQSWRAGRFQPRATGSSDFASVLDQLASPASELSRLWDREHDRYLIQRMLGRLEPDFRTSTWRAFHRVVLEGATPEMVAAELGLTVNAVLIAKSRVLQRLREQIQDLIE